MYNKEVMYSIRKDKDAKVKERADVVLRGNDEVEKRKKKQTALNRKRFYLAEPHLS